MLNSLNALAGKISPGGGLDTNANRHNHPNRNHKASSPSSPYAKPNGMSMINNNNNTSINNNNNNNNNNNEEKPDLPDPDYIKMFVGQVPRSMDENDLRLMFEEFGRVHQINVLRDKITGASKGCCFVTFFTRKAALKAQDALHNIKTLSGVRDSLRLPLESFRACIFTTFSSPLFTFNNKTMTALQQPLMVSQSLTGKEETSGLRFQIGVVAKPSPSELTVIHCNMLPAKSPWRLDCRCELNIVRSARSGRRALQGGELGKIFVDWTHCLKRFPIVCCKSFGECRGLPSIFLGFHHQIIILKNGTT
ncbi:hypothetical protein ABMA27_002258 [Loxostege sticticalis]|uniref:RRM domain-containing protein n=1 Tax=Loxostege sticticalis TaxID=481309 RepID=A0ABR3HX57_LOXSC